MSEKIDVQTVIKIQQICTRNHIDGRRTEEHAWNCHFCPDENTWKSQTPRLTLFWRKIMFTLSRFQFGFLDIQSILVLSSRRCRSSSCAFPLDYPSGTLGRPTASLSRSPHHHPPAPVSLLSLSASSAAPVCIYVHLKHSLKENRRSFAWPFVLCDTSVWFHYADQLSATVPSLWSHWRQEKRRHFSLLFLPHLLINLLSGFF